MKKWVLISDLIFAFLVTFLATLCLLRYFGWTLLGGGLVAILFGIAVASLVALFKKRKDEKLLLRHGEEKEKRLLLTHLTLLPPDKQLLLVTGIEEPVLHTRALTFAEREEELAIPLFLWKRLEVADIIPAVSLCLEKNKAGVLYCDELTPEADGVLAQFSLRAVQGGEIYRAVKEEERLPEEYLSATYFNKKKKRLPRVWFAKSNSRRFLLCGGLLLLSSLLVPFPLYYLVFGGILLLSAVLIRILGYR